MSDATFATSGNWKDQFPIVEGVDMNGDVKRGYAHGSPHKIGGKLWQVVEFEDSIYWHVLLVDTIKVIRPALVGQ